MVYASSSTKWSRIAVAWVRFPQGRPSRYFYWDDIPARRMRPETFDRETALEKVKAVAKAVQDLK
jgi:hypothetical protein